MKKSLLTVAMAGGAAFAVRRLTSKARKMRDCREMMAGRQEPTLDSLSWPSVLEDTGNEGGR